MPNSKIANVGRGVDGANALVGTNMPHLPAHPQLKQESFNFGSNVAELARHKIGSFEPPGGVIAEETKESGSHTSELPIYGQSRDMNASCSGKVVKFYIFMWMLFPCIQEP